MNRKITITGANKLFFIFTAIYMFFQVILSLVTAVISVIYGADSAAEFLNGNIYGILLINQFIIILIPVLIFVFANKLDIREVFRLNRLDLAPALIILLLAVPAYFTASMLNTVVVYLLQFIGSVPSQPIPVPGNIKELIVGILIVGVSPAVCEELLHRGVMLSAYERRGSIRAVVITAIFFGIFHFDITNLLGATFLGLLIGYYVIKTNSIFAGMLAHFLNNALSELLQYFLGGSSGTDTVIRITYEDLLGSILYGIAGLILIGLLFTLLNRVTSGKRELKPAISSVKEDFISIVSHWPIIIVLIFYFLMLILFVMSLLLTRSGAF